MFKSMSLRVLFFTGLMLICFSGLSQAADCRLRAFDGDKIEVLNCEPDTLSTSPFRVMDPGGVFWRISLVTPGSTGATKVRVAYTDPASGTTKIKAVGFTFTGAASHCEELQLIGYHPSYPLNQDYNLSEDVDCSATNPTSPAYERSLWQLGYAARFPDGVDGVPNSDDDTDEIKNALSQGELGAQGFKPLGALNNEFSKTFDGKGFKIRNLYINRASTDYVGFFSRMRDGTITNVGFVDGRVIGGAATGGLVGIVYSGVISNSYNTGSVNIATGSQQNIGGLVGTAVSVGRSIEISHCYATGLVSGSFHVGGLVGYSGNCNITDSYATGSVSGVNDVGGLAGLCTTGTQILRSYATGSVWGIFPHSVGGLVGILSSTGSILNSFSTGVATSPTDPGGLLGGRSGGTGTLTNNWWYNEINTAGVGGIPSHHGVTKANFFTDFCGSGSGTGGAVYSNWDFVDTWVAVGGLPHLKCQEGRIWNTTASVCE